jgi:hypothetical protein
VSAHRAATPTRSTALLFNRLIVATSEPSARISARAPKLSRFASKAACSRLPDFAGPGGAARAGAPIVGVVGRLAPEKHVERLAVLDRMAGVQVVVVGDGVARAKVGVHTYEPPLLLLKPVPKADDTWPAKTAIRAAEYEFEMTVGKAEVVTVPAGTFTAYPVRHFNTSIKQATPLVYWYAPDVGLVRSAAGDKLVTELKAFTPGKPAEGKK